LYTWSLTRREERTLSVECSGEYFILREKKEVIEENCRKFTACKPAFHHIGYQQGDQMKDDKLDGTPSTVKGDEK
jgi:hypothetical protein